jgi:ferredoxin
MKFTSRESLRSWIDGLAGSMQIVAPREVDGHILYRPVASSSEMAFDYQRPDLSAKEYIFPATEVLLRMEKRGSELTVEDVFAEGRQLILGLRPCDAHGFAAIDALFLAQDPPDAHYRHNRGRTVLVGLACPEMWEGCFCTSVGGAPDDQSHLDVLLREQDGGYTVEAVTQKGTDIISSLATEQREVESPPSAPAPADTPVVSPREWRALFDDEVWMRHGERCLSCRICTYVCPTCRCFDLTDRVVAQTADGTRLERIRAWDACTSTNYRRAAGGHNTRPTKPVRVRNRFFCKFCYYPDDYGPLGCVGCGRCIVSCPVDIDITEVLRDVAERSGR